MGHFQGLIKEVAAAVTIDPCSLTPRLPLALEFG
jgi:hypothetical protein